MAMIGKELEAKLFKDATYLFIKAAGDKLPNDLNVWNIKSRKYMVPFKEVSEKVLGNHKRSSFAKRFIPSIIEQYDQKGWVSNKQLGYVIGYLSEVMDVAPIDVAIKEEQAKVMAQLQSEFKADIENYIPEAKAQYDAYCAECKAQYAAQFHRGYRHYY